MVNRTLQIALCLALFLLLVFAAGGYWLLLTEPGANWVVRRLRPLVPLNIQLDSVQGALLHNFQLRGLKLTSAQGELTLKQLRLSWQPQALWKSQLELESLVVDGVKITLAASASTAEPPTSMTMPDLAPIFAQLGRWSLVLKHFSVNDLVLIDAAGKEQRLAQLSTRLELNRHTLQLSNSATRSDWGNWQGDAQLNAQNQLQLRLKGQPPPQLAPLAQVSAQLSLHRQQPDIWQGSLKLKLEPTEQAAYAFTGDVILSAESLRFTQAQFARADGQGGSVQGQLMLAWQAQLAWESQLELSALNLHPLFGAPTQINGSLAIGGGRENYTGQFNLRNQGVGWQQLQLSGKLRGSTEELALTQLKGQLLAGQVAGAVDVSWRDGLRSNFKLSSQQLNLAQLPKGPTGRVNLLLNGWLRKLPDQPLQLGGSAKIEQGQLEQRSFAGEVRGQWRGGRNLELEHLELSGDWGKLSADGNLKQRLSLKLALRDAAALWPPLQGRGQVSAWLAWPDEWQNDWPLGAISANLQQLAYGAVQIESLTLSAQQKATDLQADLQAELSGLNLAGSPLDRLTLTGRGQRAKHQLTARLSHQGRQLRLALDGALRAEQWQGQLTRLTLLAADQPQFALQKPVALALSRSAFHLARLRLKGQQGGQVEFDARGQWPSRLSPPQGQTQLALENIPLNLFNPWLPVGQSINGQLSGAINAQLHQNGALAVQGQASVLHAKIGLHNEKTSLELPLEQLSLGLDWQKNQLQSHLELTSAAVGRVSANLTLGLPARWPPSAPQDAPLAATLNFHTQESGLFALLLPAELAELRGQLNGQVQLTGTLAQPDISGKLQFAEGQLALPQLAVQLQPVELEASFAGQTLRITRFYAVSAESALNAQGEISLRNWQPASYQFRLQGDRVLLVDLPELRARFSPELTIADQGSGLFIRGKLAIPELAINNWHPNPPVSLSPDLVYVDERPAPPSASRPYRLELDLSLGDRVTVKEKGLDIRLEGGVHLSKAAGGDMLARGQINIPAGHYSAYTVKLPIRSGRLYFTGSLVDNPALDIQANRKIAEVTAGVNLSGTVRRPLVELVSDPAMDDTEILSYIILGRSTTASRGELDMLSLAAGALLSAGDSVSMQQKLKNLSGIDVVSVDSGQQGTLETTMVTLGKYLSPELYLSYGRSLTGTASEVQLRYSPGNRVEIETQMGEVSGADLYYKFEFN
jgi:autotransporter translocation and assembly factor TamB